MEFMKGVQDYGTAPEIYVDGVERVALLSPSIVRVSLFAPYNFVGKPELRTVCHLLWDRQRFLAAGAQADQARAAMAFADGFRLAVARH